VSSGLQLLVLKLLVLLDRFQGFHFEAKMDAGAHFFLVPLWPDRVCYVRLKEGAVRQRHVVCTVMMEALHSQNSSGSLKGSLKTVVYEEPSEEPIVVV